MMTRTRALEIRRRADELNDAQKVVDLYVNEGLLGVAFIHPVDGPVFEVKPAYREYRSHLGHVDSVDGDRLILEDPDDPA